MKFCAYLLSLSFILNFAYASEDCPENFKSNKLTLMSYNIENLFDLKHDRGKEDWSYLPMTQKMSDERVFNYCEGLYGFFRRFCFEVDWNQENLQTKVTNLSRVIFKAQSQEGPDILMVQEVENIHALEALANKLNEKLPHCAKKYTTVTLLEGPDERGIDTGAISKYPVSKARSHEIDLSEIDPNEKTRDILEVKFLVGKHSVTVFNNHWPSQGNPDTHRLKASEVLLKKAYEASQNSDLVVALGDFNSLKDDSPHGIKQNITPHFHDAEKEKRIRGYSVFEGTHYFRGNWSSLDRIFVFKSSLKNSSLIPLWNSFKIHKPGFALIYDQRHSKLKPMRYSAFQMTGFSDHLPITQSFFIQD